MAKGIAFYDKIEFIDDNSSLAIGKANQLKNLLCEYRNVCLAIGNSNARLDIIGRLERIGY